MTSITIIGNLTRDPEVRTTNSGSEIVELSVASNEGKDKTVFWQVKYFANKAGEIAKKHAKKGSCVGVSGSVNEETWGEGENKKSKLVCMAHSFNFVGTPKSAETEKATTPAKPAAKPAAAKSSPEDSSDDVPF